MKRSPSQSVRCISCELSCQLFPDAAVRASYCHRAAFAIWPEGNGFLQKGIIEKLPCFADDIMFVKHIAGQLCSDSLISIVDFDTPVSTELARAKRTTKYGDEFLKFIQDYQ